MYQVSTLQALAMGHTRPVIEVAELKKHGTTGLGTFAGVDGEMIMLDGECFRAKEDGTVVVAEENMGVPFASVSNFVGLRSRELSGTEKETGTETGTETETETRTGTENGSASEAGVKNIETLKRILNNMIEEDFGLNSMHVARIDGEFNVVHARSETAYHAIHVSLKDMLSETQKSFRFDDVKGTLVCVYYPDYMDGINAAGWHLHFISKDRTKGGHVFELEMKKGTVRLDKISNIELELPSEPVFDTYSLKNASEDEIKKVEQGKE